MLSLRSLFSSLRVLALRSLRSLRSLAEVFSKTKHTGKKSLKSVYVGLLGKGIAEEKS